METGDRVTVADPKSPFYRHGGIATQDGELWDVFLNSRPVDAPMVFEFPPLFRGSQLAGNTK